MGDEVREKSGFGQLRQIILQFVQLYFAFQTNKMFSALYCVPEGSIWETM